MNNDEMAEELAGFNMAHTRIHSRADELIACLEGEIAKRDARIVELERYRFAFNEWHDKTEWVQAESATLSAKYLGCHRADVMRSLIDDLREELAACRVAVENCEVFRARIAELEARIVWLECEAQVNAAPVSEAKAQGVVMPEPLTAAITRADDVLHAISSWDSSSVKLEQRHGSEWAKEVDAIRRELHTQLARLNAAQAAPAADAYSWRRKEGVNGIKEFMAQKCYDAQTDAIKKYYEPFKCANCKAADAGLVEALEHARLFIVNGIALGFIQMPEADTPDPAHETLPMIDAALSAGKDSGQ